MKFTKLLAAAAGAFMVAGVAQAGTLQDVLKRGELICLINVGVPAWAYTDAKGEWQGFDVDFCRATAAAILGSPKKVKFVTTTGKTRFTALSAGEGDILYRNTTATMSRDVDLKLNFAGINYYDGQGFMVNKKLNVKSAKQLNGASVCIQTGTTTELNLADFFRLHKMKYEPVTVETEDESTAAYTAGRCDVYTTDASGLAAVRSKLAKPDDHIILPELISKEPLGPAVREGDDQWLNVTSWVLNGLKLAEEYGVTQANVDKQIAENKNPDVRRLLGLEGNFGEQLGLSKDWMVKAIKGAGNYGEIFERNLGMKTPVRLERGLNAMYTDGGLQYAPPIR